VLVLAAVTGIVLGFVAALIYANGWILSAVMTVSVIAWLAGILALFYSRASERPLILGAMLAGSLYVLLAIGPWFRTHVGPWLLTTRALAHVETTWLGREAQPVVNQTIPAPFYYGSTGWTGNVTGSGLVTVPQVSNPYGSSILWTAPTIPQPSPMIQTGHWLFGWLAAAVGSVAAMWLVRRTRGGTAALANANSQASESAGENPFAEVAP
jgi:hypothetical protein